MRFARQKGLTYSSILHLLLLVFLVAGLPTLFEITRDPPPTVLTVEVLPISSISNVKPSEAKPAPKQAPEKKPEAKKPTPPVKTAEKKPTPPPVPEKPSEKKPEPKPEEKKPEEKKPEKKIEDDDLLAVLKSVKENAAKEQKDTKEKTPEETSPTKSKSLSYDPSKPMSLSEVDAIKNQIAKCWITPAGAKDAYDLVIPLHALYQPDGTLIKVELQSKAKDRYASDSFFRAATDSAMRAVRNPECNPLKNMPADKYDTWKDIDFNFDPKEMLL